MWVWCLVGGYWLSNIVLYFVSDRFSVRLYFISRLSTIVSYNVLISLLCSIASNVKQVSKNSNHLWSDSDSSKYVCNCSVDFSCWIIFEYEMGVRCLDLWLVMFEFSMWILMGSVRGLFLDDRIAGNAWFLWVKWGWRGCFVLNNLYWFFEYFGWVRLKP